ncbi:UPF0489 protein C5orf22 like protein [Argiope bruennichi]|uniref:UPF0489 protein C5orf22 like protein n=1 Tax=Argiope bruennichi TaxID=94029 RepID=A0A8T0F6S1_ARGBR|nr:UPF0489 protein C5orf22 like protein [Argiope bruennichi]
MCMTYVKSINFASKPPHFRASNKVMEFGIECVNDLPLLQVQYLGEVSCTQSYFVSELSWCPEADLKGARDVVLQVCTLGSPPEVEKGSQVTPCAEHGEESSPKTTCTLSEEVKKKMDTCPYVLDIDLDFFSTRNPFYSIFNEKQFDILRKLYHYEHPSDLTDENLHQVTAKRREQLSELKSIFNNVRDGMEPSASPL